MVSIAFFTLVHVARAEESATKSPCSVMDGNHKESVEVAEANETAQTCRDQIKESLDACLVDPKINDAEKASFTYQDVQNGGVSLYEKQNATWSEGNTRYTAAANLCRGENDKVQKACEQAKDDLKTALRSAGETQTQAKAALLIHTGTKAAVDAANDAVAQLQKQINATQKAKTTASRAIDQQVTCVQGQADLMASAIQQLNKNAVQETQNAGATTTNTEHVTAASEGGAPAEAKAGEAKAGEAGEANKTWYQKLAGNEEVKEAVLTASGDVGKGTFGVMAGVQQNDVAGTVQSSAGWAKDIGVTSAMGDGFARQAVEAVAGRTALAGLLVMQPKSSQSACADVNHYQPNAVAAGGCSGISGIDASQLNSTVSTLNAP